MDVLDSMIMDMDAIMICRICLVLMSRLLAFVKQLINFLHVIVFFSMFSMFSFLIYLKPSVLRDRFLSTVFNLRLASWYISSYIHSFFSLDQTNLLLAACFAFFMKKVTLDPAIIIYHLYVPAVCE